MGIDERRDAVKAQAFGFFVKLFVHAFQDTPVSIDFPRGDFALFVSFYHLEPPSVFNDCTAVVSRVSSPFGRPSVLWDQGSAYPK